MVLLQAADLLDSDILKKVVAHLIFRDINKQIPAKNGILTSPFFNKEVYKSIIPEITRQLYFDEFKLEIKKNNLKSYSNHIDGYSVFTKITQIIQNLGYLFENNKNPEDLNLSIKDYLDYVPDDISARIHKYDIHLQHLLLTRLEGINDIPGIEENDTEVVLYRNIIRKIPANAFYKLHKLRRLNLDNNRISEIDHNAFQGLDNLAILYLKDNHLHDLPANIFKPTPLLVHLLLSSNPLSALDPSIFNNLQHLQTVKLPKYSFQMASFDILKNNFPKTKFKLE